MSINLDKKVEVRGRRTFYLGLQCVFEGFNICPCVKIGEIEDCL